MRARACTFPTIRHIISSWAWVPKWNLMWIRWKALIVVVDVGFHLPTFYPPQTRMCYYYYTWIDLHIVLANVCHTVKLPIYSGQIIWVAISMASMRAHNQLPISCHIQNRKPFLCVYLENKTSFRHIAREKDNAPNPEFRDKRRRVQRQGVKRSTSTTCREHCRSTKHSISFASFYVPLAIRSFLRLFAALHWPTWRC